MEEKKVEGGDNDSRIVPLLTVEEEKKEKLIRLPL